MTAAHQPKYRLLVGGVVGQALPWDLTDEQMEKLLTVENRPLLEEFLRGLHDLPRAAAAVRRAMTELPTAVIDTPTGPKQVTLLADAVAGPANRLSNGLNGTSASGGSAALAAVMAHADSSDEHMGAFAIVPVPEPAPRERIAVQPGDYASGKYKR